MFPPPSILLVGESIIQFGRLEHPLRESETEALQSNASDHPNVNSRAPAVAPGSPTAFRYGTWNISTALAT
jgi:hypothetical protein